ncbi:serine/threonine-protein kinase [Nonomuraea sp. NBC_01738]|uniref:serine/threonine-protein kinase n=1 Tax=Nonomuraea sp. NBC_01738 TaxID=2976003 RepID=UPI002E162B3B|nr:serine/threonine-protein kinase [Nonomuraea sp. NBC_01738]
MAERRPLGPDDPARIGDHRLTHVLGEGGQGIVYLGHATDGRQVAIKVLHARRATDPAEKRRFTRESTIIARLAPFCTAAVLGMGELNGRPYLVSDYIPGPTLDELVIESGPMGSGLDQLAVTTLTALAAVHRAGIVHRDFKPSNVIMGPVGPTVIDFGIARLTDRSTTRSGLVGTPAYLAPELLDGQTAGPAADVFAWAATMVYAATGHRAFPGETQAAVLAAILTGTPDLTGVPGRLAPILAACFTKAPQDRPTADALLDHFTNRVPRSAVPDRPLPARRRINRRAVLAAVVTTGAAGAAGLLLPSWLEQRPGTSPPSTAATTNALRGSPTGSPRPALLARGMYVAALALGRLGDLPIAVTGNIDNTVRMWNLSTGEQHGRTMKGTPPSRGYGWINAIAIGQLDGKTVAVSGSGDDIVVWDLETCRRYGKPLNSADGINEINNVHALALAQLPGRTVAVSDNGFAPSVLVWDLENRRQYGESFTGLTGPEIKSLTVGQVDGRAHALASDANKGLLIWDLEAGERRGTPLIGHTDTVNAVAIGQLGDKAIAVSGSSDGTMRFWDLPAGKQRGEPVPVHPRGVDWVGIGQVGGKTVAVSRERDNVLRVWDVESGQQQGKPLRGRYEIGLSAAVGRLADRTILLSAAWEGNDGARETRMWDLGSSV